MSVFRFFLGALVLTMSTAFAEDTFEVIYENLHETYTAVELPSAGIALEPIGPMRYRTVHRVDQTGPTLRIAVRVLDPRLNYGGMQMLTSLTKGRFFPATNTITHTFRVVPGGKVNFFQPGEGPTVFTITDVPDSTEIFVDGARQRSYEQSMRNGSLQIWMPFAHQADSRHSLQFRKDGEVRKLSLESPTGGHTVLTYLAADVTSGSQIRRERNTDAELPTDILPGASVYASGLQPPPLPIREEEPKTPAAPAPAPTRTFATTPKRPVANAAQGVPATLRVRVMLDTFIYINSFKTIQEGEIRTFKTPPIPPGKTYAAEIKFDYRNPSSGRRVIRIAKLKFRPGDALNFDDIEGFTEEVKGAD